MGSKQDSIRIQPAHFKINRKIPPQPSLSSHAHTNFTHSPPKTLTFTIPFTIDIVPHIPILTAPHFHNFHLLQEELQSESTYQVQLCFCNCLRLPSFGEHTVFFNLPSTTVIAFFNLTVSTFFALFQLPLSTSSFFTFNFSRTTSPSVFS